MANCVACDEPTSGRWTLPVDTLGRIVHAGYPAQHRTLRAACEGCAAVHVAAGPDALDAHLAASHQLRERLRAERRHRLELERAFARLVAESRHVLAALELEAVRITREHLIPD